VYTTDDITTTTLPQHVAK